MNLSQKIISQIEKSLLGKPDIIRLAVACFLAEGHLLIDDIPGVGKTTLAVAMSHAIGGRFQRVQFTSDLLPSDILGVSIFNARSNAFDFKPGPLFHHVILADEINRASPKTQSALLESMQERQVTIDNQTHALPQPFFVVATQNPHDQYGTFPLPESQLDRFMMRLHVGYPDKQVELDILRQAKDFQSVAQLPAVTDMDAIHKEISAIQNIAIDVSLDNYMVELAQATRHSAHIDLGVSPRGTLALRRAAQAMANTYGRTFVTPDDVRAVAIAVLAHRLRLKSDRLNGNKSSTEEALVHDILDQVPIPV